MLKSVWILFPNNTHWLDLERYWYTTRADFPAQGLLKYYFT